MKTKQPVISGLFGILLLSNVLLSCETIVSPTLEPAPPVLVVDGWINNKPGAQVILLTLSQPYFESTLPPAVSGAVVNVTDDTGKIFSFPEDDKAPGHYVWKPVATEVFGSVGRKYKLNIQSSGDTFEAMSAMGRVPVIDSITFDTEKRIGSKDSITRGEFWSTDPIGPGDAYWIRATKNGVSLHAPSEINVAFDAGFSPGSETDGVVFITPVRRGINPNETDANGKQLSPFIKGDSINVQIHSITLAAFNYLNEVAIQTDRPGGFQELFATPLANVTTNIKNTNSTGRKAVGFFNVSAVSAAGKRFKK
jgi:hypothetical protein